MIKTLDLGCGDKPRNPFHAEELYGIDVRDNLAGTIRSADLAIEPIPFDDNSFDYVTAYDFLEHVPRVVYAPQRRNAFVEVMNEVYRVLKPGGIFFSQTPGYPHGMAFRDPTHVNFITEETFPQYFDDQLRWASIYGFKGAFRVRQQKWVGQHLIAALQKTRSPDWPTPPTPDNYRVTVVIPVHDARATIAGTLDAILAEAIDDIEILCIDDASTDGTTGILNEYAAKNRCIKVIATPQRLGWTPRLLNFALPHVTGTYLLYATQDRPFSTAGLREMRAQAIETGADAVISDGSLQDGGRLLNKSPGMAATIHDGRDVCLRSLGVDLRHAVLWNTQLVKQVGFGEFSSNADAYTVRRLLLECRKVVMTAEPCLYRQEPDVRVDGPGNSTIFDEPLTRLRIAQLLCQNGVDLGIVQREFIDAKAMMTRLENQLTGEWSNSWHADDVTSSQAAIASFNQYLQAEQIFAWSGETKPTSNRYAKWRNSLRKLPKKLGLR